MEIRKIEINICTDCLNLVGEMCHTLNLVGEMCHTPECVFCRRTMKEVEEYLNMLLIRPIIDGVGIELWK
jgi:hypothetical protein